MKAKRKIHLIGDINHDLYEKFVVELEELEKSSDEIEICLCSDGGDAYVALAFFDRIQRSHCSTVVTATGLVASAAVLILAAGDRRRMTKHAWVMVHEEGVTLSDDARVKQAEKDVAHYRRLETQWNDVLTKVTGVHHDDWAVLHQAETYLDAEECKKLNLTTELL